MPPWTIADMPSLTGRTAVITGTGGLGLQIAVALARAGAAVVLAGRDAQKGADAVARVRAETPAADAVFEQLDLANLASVAEFGARLRAGRPHVDVLINNAGVMAPPTRRLTADGFEQQFGTNVLGHVALTAQLMPLLRARHGRVVTMSSIGANSGRIDFENLQAEREYDAMAAYNQSKLADLMFARELQRHSDTGGWQITSYAAHPGIARTDLIANGVGRRSPLGVIGALVGPLLFQSAAKGALPALYAATAPGIPGGSYIGPDGPGEIRGNPHIANVPAQAEDAAVSARLWDTCVALTGAQFAN